jgi:hypothetical protein
MSGRPEQPRRAWRKAAAAASQPGAAPGRAWAARVPFAVRFVGRLLARPFAYLLDLVRRRRRRRT